MWKTLPQCKAVFLWKTVDCFFYKVTKSRKVEWKSSCLQISGSSPIPGSSCSSDTTWCCNLLERRRKLSSTQWLQDAHWVLLFIQRGTAGSPKSGAQVWTQLPPQWLVWLEENLTIPLSPNLQHFWLKACEWMLLHKSWQNYMMAEQALLLNFQQHLCYEDQCLYTFVSLWDTGPWKSWRGRNMHSTCQ